MRFFIPLLKKHIFKLTLIKLSHGLTRTSKTKDKMKKKLLQCNNSENKLAFTVYRNSWYALIQKCKLVYCSNKIVKSNNDLETLYKIINEVTDS